MTAGLLEDGALLLRLMMIQNYAERIHKQSAALKLHNHFEDGKKI